MVGVAGVRQLGPCAHVRLPPLGRRRTGLFHGAPRKTHGGGALERLLFVATKPHSLCGGGGQHRGRRTGLWPQGLLLAELPPRVAGHPCDEDKEGGSLRMGLKAEGGKEHLLKGFGCANDTMINNHSLRMKGRGQVYSNEEQFAFPLLIYNQILYHVFLCQP
jgi:hypothetical protein